VYGKLFASMYDGTLATKGPWQAIVAFQQFLALADAAGWVDMTPEAISRRTTIPLEIIQTGIAALELPDPESRSPAEEGRRIVRLDPDRAWGWRIVNHEHYKKLRAAEERREYFRDYQRERRSTPVNNGQQPLTNGQHELNGVHDVTDAVSSKQYAVSSKKRTTKRKKPKATEQPSPFPKSACDLLYETWTTARGAIDYGVFRKALKPLYPTAGPRYTEPQLVDAIKAHAEYVEGLAPREAGFENIHKFAADAQRWVRIGGMPAVDPNTRELTERGRLAFA
jgi:hypothetical protein